MNGKEIGKIIKDAYIEIYGNSDNINQVFGGGNPGLVALGLCISEASKNIQVGLESIAESIHVSKVEEVKSMIDQLDSVL